MATADIDPTGDSTPLQWTPTGGSGTHASCVNKATRQPTAPSLTDFISAFAIGSMLDDTLLLGGAPSISGTVATIVVWTYGVEGAAADTTVSLNQGGSFLTPQATLGLAIGWFSNTFTPGSPFTQTDLNNLAVQYAAPINDSSYVYASYVEFTYTPASVRRRGGRSTVI